MGNLSVFTQAMRQRQLTRNKRKRQWPHCKKGKIAARCDKGKDLRKERQRQTMRQDS